MLLLDDELRNRLPPLYAQQSAKDPWIHAKYFLPGTAWEWLVMEGSPQDRDFLFFGFVVGLESELGYFLLSELEQVRAGGVFRVERDLHFREGKLTDVVSAP